MSSQQADTEFGRMRKQRGLGEDISPSFEALVKGLGDILPVNRNPEFPLIGGD